MPTYEYRCSNCKHELEEFQSIMAKPLRKCPACGKNTLKRLIGTGAGVVFKGSGFWQTDYARSGEYKKSAAADSKPAGSESKSDAKSSESKSSEPKSENAPARTETPKSEPKPAAEKKSKKKAS